MSSESARTSERSAEVRRASSIATGAAIAALVVSGVLITALGALGFRGGGEGMYDASRQKAGDVKASDVQP
jgi:hypothetical protein